MVVCIIKFILKYKEIIMPFQTHDPYLNTIKREISDKYYKNRKQRIENEHQKGKSFLSQKVHIHNFINLNEGTLNIVIFIAFVVIPYITGIAFIFLLIANANYKTFENINLNPSDYLIYWTIGYELLAMLLILLIIKSAISFKRTTYFHKNNY